MRREPSVKPTKDAYTWNELVQALPAGHTRSGVTTTPKGKRVIRGRAKNKVARRSRRKNRG